MEPHQLISWVKIMYTVDAGMFSNHCELEQSEASASLTFTKEAVLDSIFAEYTILPICFAAVWMKKNESKSTFRWHSGLLVSMESLLVTLSWECLTLSVCHFYQWLSPYSLIVPIKCNIFYDYEMTYISLLKHLCDNMLETHKLVFTFKSEMKLW